MNAHSVFVLGGFQTDFEIHYARAGKGVLDLFKDAVTGALRETRIEPREVGVAHVANFIGEHTCYQAHLNAMFLEVDPVFSGLPTMRHEAACASGGVALLAAMADIEAERYDCACVAGVEMERNLPTTETATHLGLAAWFDRECRGVTYPWPRLFSRLADEYDRRYGLKREHLSHLARNAFQNARRNPNAQTRNWTITEDSFGESDEHNPVIEGRIRRQDCSQVTDGGVAVMLASARFAREYAQRHGFRFEDLVRIKGWGHRTARLAFDDKMAEAAASPYVFPHVRGAIQDAFRRAKMPGVEALDCIETHDCFTPTAYMAIDHFGITPPGENWKAIEDGTIDFGGRLPLNPSGGLIGVGHPVGASGVRMVLDVYKQVAGCAGAYQIPGARTGALFNMGGSATTNVCLILGRD
ncbi:MAG TPA: acetyl-CoA acetyltransferase [Candidatus Hydrogenedentes bacterium]|nr:acetyl-CoA acetyltransferase [Candidatus Hydrogenedentota bacterium]HNT86804.1 acetyl-CoA acetyltransferase [Candidatus Hydrogenedentota bacterium]